MLVYNDFYSSESLVITVLINISIDNKIITFIFLTELRTIL